MGRANPFLQPSPINFQDGPLRIVLKVFLFPNIPRGGPQVARARLAALWMSQEKAAGWSSWDQEQGNMYVDCRSEDSEKD
jgi:hypothetical protein